MLKKTLVSVLVCLGLSTGVAATELQEDMGKLSGSVSALQMGFFTNDKASTLAAAASLRVEIKQYVGNRETITKLLPADVKYKASIAINSAKMIEKYAKEIESALTNKNMRMIDRQMKTQKAFLEIQNQCFRCHNLVRDWQ